MSEEKKVLLLVGGGHVHVQVIKDLASNIKAKVKPVVISDTPYSMYSGMLPAVVAGLCDEKDAVVDLPRLCKKYGWEMIIGKVTAINPEKKQVYFQPKYGSSKIECAMRYDILSINVGSKTKPLSIETAHITHENNVNELDKPTIIRTRPISDLVGALERFEKSASQFYQDSIDKVIQVVVIGAGAAGLELVLAIDSRFVKTIGKAKLTLISNEESYGMQFGRMAGNAIMGEIRRRKVDLKIGKRVISYGDSKVVLEGGQKVDADVVIVATGAAPHDWMRKTNLNLDVSGWINIRPTLQSLEYDEVFACGDCASFNGVYGECFPPKAGVYAVRQGPVLTENLENFVSCMYGKEKGLKGYVPQPSFLSLLSLGDGRGLGTKYGLSFKGSWVFRLKTHIDEEWQMKFRTSADDDNGTEEQGVEQKLFDGSTAEAAVILLAAEEIGVSDCFEKQLSVLRRLDQDEVFREQFVSQI